MSMSIVTVINGASRLLACVGGRSSGPPLPSSSRGLTHGGAGRTCKKGPLSRNPRKSVVASNRTKSPSSCDPSTVPTERNSHNKQVNSAATDPVTRAYPFSAPRNVNHGSLECGPTGTTRPGRKCLVLLLAACFLQHHACLAAQYIKTQLKLAAVFTRYFPQTERPDEYSTVSQTNIISPITCIVGPESWQLEGKFLQNAIERCYFDGTNVLMALYPTTARGAADTTPSVEAGNALKAGLTINIMPNTGGYAGDSHNVNIVWLALCSGSYLQRPGRIIPYPACIVMHSPYAFGYLDTTETYGDAMGLPKSVVFRTSRSLMEASIARFAANNSRSVQSYRSPPATEDGRVRFEYHVRRSTNWHGVHLPLEFTFLEHPPAGTAAALYQAFSGVGWVTSISTSAPPSGVYDGRHHYEMADWRFRDNANKVVGIVYSSTNEFTVATNNPSLQPVFAATVRASRNSSERSGGQGMLLFGGLIFVAALSPVAVMALQRRKTHKNPVIQR